MKKFWWLLALPYVVIKTTSSYEEPRCAVVNKKDHFEYLDGPCGDLPYDMAEALNEAHARRTHSKDEITGTTYHRPSASDLNPTPNIGTIPCSCGNDGGAKNCICDDNGARIPQFDYKSACGQDDCGKDSP